MDCPSDGTGAHSGNIPAYRSELLPLVTFHNQPERYGLDVYQKAMLVQPESMFGQLIGYNLVWTNGDDWRRLRRIINPAFKGQWDTKVFGKLAHGIMRRWDVLGKDDSVEVHDWMQRFHSEQSLL
jgi:cytochrome P450